jgi:glutaredoxin 3
MRQNHWDAQVYDLGHMTDGMSIQAQLLTMTGQATVPSVWINGKFLGGNSDTQSAFQTGELSRMLNGTNHANSNLAPAVEN